MRTIELGTAGLSIVPEGRPHRGWFALMLAVTAGFAVGGAFPGFAATIPQFPASSPLRTVVSCGGSGCSSPLDWGSLIDIRRDPGWGIAYVGVPSYEMAVFEVRADTAPPLILLTGNSGFKEIVKAGSAARGSVWLIESEGRGTKSVTAVVRFVDSRFDLTNLRSGTVSHWYAGGVGGTVHFTGGPIGELPIALTVLLMMFVGIVGFVTASELRVGSAAMLWVFAIGVSLWAEIVSHGVSGVLSNEYASRGYVAGVGFGFAVLQGALVAGAIVAGTALVGWVVRGSARWMNRSGLVWSGWAVRVACGLLSVCAMGALISVIDGAVASVFVGI